MSKPLADSQTLQDALQDLDGEQFEHFLGDLWELKGWDTEVEQYSKDMGVDVRATKENRFTEKVLIQAKRYGPNTTVGSQDVQQYHSLKDQEDGVDKVIVVTTNRFTDGAKDLADLLNVKLVNGSALAEEIQEQQAYEELLEYTGHSALKEAANEAKRSQEIEGESFATPVESGVDFNYLMNNLGEGPGQWQYWILGSLAAILLGIPLYSYNSTLSGVAIFLGFVGLTGALYKDIKFIQASNAKWSPSRLVLIGLIFLAFPFLPLYAVRHLWKRLKTVGI